MIRVCKGRINTRQSALRVAHLSTNFVCSMNYQQQHRFHTGVHQQQEQQDDVNKKYSHTLILPTTQFSMRANALENEPKLQEYCSRLAYQWQKENLSDEKQFVLHDGPPYANGSLHMGHALNKILKDIINRYKLLRGYKINYIPGWDCHGLPIELKAINHSLSEKISPVEIRQIARDFAQKTIEKQKTDFIRWGVMGDWDTYYTTMDKEFEARQLEIFMSMYTSGCIYRGLRPVYWSPSSKTALAEAELEYPDVHISKSVYLLFPIVTKGSASLDGLTGGLYTVIWTTTPWTLMANEAVCYHDDVQYVILRAENVQSGTVKHFMVAQDLLEKFTAKVGEKYKFTQIKSIKGKDLQGLSCEHPYVNGKLVPLLHGAHVTTEVGTGFVHTAPGHGMEDFLIGKKHNLPLTSPVDDSGNYTADVILPEFAGKHVFTEGNEGVIKILQENQDERLVLLENYSHKYPYDWRTKKPVLIRATKQWFADLSHLKDSALKALESVSMVPDTGRHRLNAFVQGRSEWCISRQRVWGVPIPVFYRKDAGPDEKEYLATPESIGYIIDLFRKHGADCWWTLSTEELLAPQYRNTGIEYVKGTDTLDVWFDSGTTWYGVIQRHGLKTPVDVYLEGSDQHRGWFQSSLLTSVAHANGQAPYKTVITHGFILDQKGKKMSKSLGNIIEPSQIVEGKTSEEIVPPVQEETPAAELSEKEKKKLEKKLKQQKAAEKKQSKQNPAYGADVLRFWTALSDFTTDVSLGEDVIAGVSDSVKKIRNTARFLLANLNDFKKDMMVPYEQLTSIDKFMLSKLHEFNTQIEEEYEKFSFYRVQQLLVKFTFNISSLYLDAIKDRLYTEAANSPLRRSCQTVLAYILDSYSKAIAPILCHTAEDVYQHSPLKNGDLPSIFAAGWLETRDEWDNQLIKSDWEIILKLRPVVYQCTEHAKHKKLFGTSSEAHVEIYSESAELNQALARLKKGEIEEALIVSKVEQTENNFAEGLVLQNEINSLNRQQTELDIPQEDRSEYIAQANRIVDPVYIRVSPSRDHKCPRCWRFVSPGPHTLCNRCDSVVSSLQ